jgi:hypothetical protein
MPKKDAKSFGAQIGPDIQRFLDETRAYVKQRQEKDPTDPIKMPGNTTLINKLIELGPVPRAIIDHLCPPPAQVAGQLDENSCADASPQEIPRSLDHAAVQPEPAVQHMPLPVTTGLADTETISMAPPICLPVPATVALVVEAIPAETGPSPRFSTPRATYPHRLPSLIALVAIILGISAIIPSLSLLHRTEGDSDLASENHRLRAHLAGMKAVAGNQAATSGAKSETNATSTASHPDASTMPRGSTASKYAAESVIDAATINDLRAANAELREKLKVWDEKEPLIVKRLNADAATIDALTREIAKLKSAHTRIGPQVVGSSEGRP